MLNILVRFKKKIFISVIPVVFCAIFFACNSSQKESLITQSKTEIEQTEKDFAQMAQEKGVKDAFLNFAADSAVLYRGNRLVKGKQAIKEYFEKQTIKDVHLEWAPDFIDVSSSGDLGYTYGKYTFSATDTSGQAIEDQGIFHTVWKKQADGKWRFVWD